eukprot:scaffold284478_cov23-Tisochrysis_lutea.AAC.1
MLQPQHAAHIERFLLRRRTQAELSQRGSPAAHHRALSSLPLSLPAACSLSSATDLYSTLQ